MPISYWKYSDHVDGRGEHHSLDCRLNEKARLCPLPSLHGVDRDREAGVEQQVDVKGIRGRPVDCAPAPERLDQLPFCYLPADAFCGGVGAAAAW
jgi:hypothetical protein